MNIKHITLCATVLFMAGCSTPVINCPDGPRVKLNQAIPKPPPLPIVVQPPQPVPAIEEKKVQTEKARIYFARTAADNEGCPSVRYVERKLEVGEQFASSVVRELIYGPHDGEKARGFSTAFPPETVLKDLTVKGGTVTVHFESLKLVPNEGCSRDILRRQIISTVMSLNLDGVKIVRITTSDNSWL